MLPLDYTITFSLGAIVGFCVRIVIEDKIIRKRDKDKRHEDAVNIFAQAFNPAFHLLGQNDESSYAIVYAELPKHKTAMLNFVHLLEGTDKNRFNANWAEYENKCKEIEEHGKTITILDGFPGLFEFANDPNEIQRDKVNKEELSKLIQGLLITAKK